MLLGRQVDSGFTVKQHPAVQHDPPPIRGHDPRDAFEGHALAAAGGPQQGQRFRLRLKADVQMEIPQLLFNFHKQAQAVPLLFPPDTRKSRRSSIFTVSSTTAEMLRLTITHFIANASLLVCQSW